VVQDKLTHWDALKMILMTSSREFIVCLPSWFKYPSLMLVWDMLAGVDKSRQYPSQRSVAYLGRAYWLYFSCDLVMLLAWDTLAWREISVLGLDYWMIGHE
jgi:hypothetical protein